MCLGVHALLTLSIRTTVSALLLALLTAHNDSCFCMCNNAQSQASALPCHSSMAIIERIGKCPSGSAKASENVCRKKVHTCLLGPHNVGDFNAFLMSELHCAIIGYRDSLTASCSFSTPCAGANGSFSHLQAHCYVIHHSVTRQLYQNLLLSAC